MLIVYELDTCSIDLNTKFLLSNCFGAVKLIKNANCDKFRNSGYGIGFDARSSFPINGHQWCKNIFCFQLRKKFKDNRK